MFINETQVGAGQVRDRFLLESAVERPQATFGGEDLYPTIHTKAAALMQSLVGNHPFVDGNKRTGLLSTVVFYGMNGYWLNMPSSEAVGLVLDIATSREREVDDIASRLERYAL